MKLSNLAEAIGAKVLTHQQKASKLDIDRVYAGDNISALLNEASETALLVTNLKTSQLLRVAELMDISGICLLNGIVPEPELVTSAREHATVLIVSPVGMFETCGRLYQCLSGKA